MQIFIHFSYLLYIALLAYLIKMYNNKNFLRYLFCFLAVLIFALKVSAQRIVYHDKDPFSHIETTTTDYNALTGNSLAFTAFHETDNKIIDTLYLTFSVPAANDAKSIADTSTGFCEILLKDKQVCSGLYAGQLSYTSGGIQRHAITYYFSKACYSKLLAQNATAVKLSLRGKHLGLFQIDADKQGKIADALKLILTNTGT